MINYILTLTMYLILWTASTSIIECEYEINYPNSGGDNITAYSHNYAETYYIDNIPQYLTDNEGVERMIYSFVDMNTEETVYFTAGLGTSWYMKRINCN